jgi:hypothetical protein
MFIASPSAPSNQSLRGFKYKPIKITSVYHAVMSKRASLASYILAGIITNKKTITQIQIMVEWHHKI